MKEKKVISFFLKSDFGFLRKPDTNEGVQLSFNMLHKPALLGILGAILGLEGYRVPGKWPDYYKKLKDTKVGIAPLEGKHERGNFSNTVLTYTNGVGYANADGNLIVTESTLISPAFQVFILIEPEINLHQKLEENLVQGLAQFIPYFGKNECYAWWDPETVSQYQIEPFSGTDQPFTVDTIFFKQEPISSQRHEEQPQLFLSNLDADDFLYFERLPIGFNEELRQYQYADFAYSNCQWGADTKLGQLYLISDGSESKVIQLF